jgi:prevent-host-death family protein
MLISVSDAKAQLTDLVHRAEAGDEIILTRHGQPTVRLTPVKKPHDPVARMKLIEEIQNAAAGKALPGPCAARSQDFLYGEDGLPE